MKQIIYGKRMVSEYVRPEKQKVTMTIPPPEVVQRDINYSISSLNNQLFWDIYIDL